MACEVLRGMRPVIVMVLSQASAAGINVFYKLAMAQGMSMRVLVAYRFIFATAFLAPIAFFLERNSRPKLTWMIVFQGFLTGLFGGSLGQNLYIESLALTTATFAAAMTNLIPAFTFILAILFRLETLGIRNWAGKSKAAGTLVGIGGAMVFTLYKGREVKLWSTDINLVKDDTESHEHHMDMVGDQILGSFLALASCLSYSFWMITQAKLGKRYPCFFSSTTMMCGFASAQATVYAICMDRDWSQWKLGWNIRLYSVAYTGVFATGVMVTVVAWCVRERGPLFTTIFMPLSLMFVAVLGSLILDETLYLGSFIGSSLIVMGLYCVVWGRAKEMKRLTQLAPADAIIPTDIETPVFFSSSPTDSSKNSLTIPPHLIMKP